VTIHIGGPPGPGPCIFGCSSICIINCGGGGPPGGKIGGCVGPGCSGGNGECVREGCDEGCEGDDCDCEENKTVTSCGVLCTETVLATSTITGDCSTTTCITTNCGSDTTTTSTTTITEDDDIFLTADATDLIYVAQTTGAYVADVYGSVMSWWSVEDFYATAVLADTIATTPIPSSTSPGLSTTTIGTGSLSTVVVCQPTSGAQLLKNDVETGITGLCTQCQDLDIVFDNGGSQAQGYISNDVIVGAEWAGGSCAAFDFTNPAATRCRDARTTSRRYMISVSLCIQSGDQVEN
jgi:hypothetical protein